MMVVVGADNRDLIRNEDSDLVTAFGKQAAGWVVGGEDAYGFGKRLQPADQPGIRLMPMFDVFPVSSWWLEVHLTVKPVFAKCSGEGIAAFMRIGHGLPEKCEMPQIQPNQVVGGQLAHPVIVHIDTWRPARLHVLDRNDSRNTKIQQFGGYLRHPFEDKTDRFPLPQKPLELIQRTVNVDQPVVPSQGRNTVDPRYKPVSIDLGENKGDTVALHGIDSQWFGAKTQQKSAKCAFDARRFKLYSISLSEFCLWLSSQTRTH